MRARQRQKIIERALHRLCFARSVAMDAAEVRVLLDAFQGWADAHRDGNGERSERAVQQAVDRSLLGLERLLDQPNSAHAMLHKAAVASSNDPLTPPQR